jgi:hypothetical protein
MAPEWDSPVDTSLKEDLSIHDPIVLCLLQDGSWIRQSCWNLLKRRPVKLWPICSSVPILQDGTWIRQSRWHILRRSVNTWPMFIPVEIITLNFFFICTYVEYQLIPILCAEHYPVPVSCIFTSSLFNQCPESLDIGTVQVFAVC